MSSIGIESKSPAPANPARSSLFESLLNIKPSDLRPIGLFGYALTFVYCVDLLYIKLNAYPAIFETKASPNPKQASTYTSSSSPLVGFVV